MPISEQQLEIWSHQGSIKQSSETYAAVKAVLEAKAAAYPLGDVSIFLQGSYGNDTNIWADSDVDVVIQLNASIYYDDHELPEPMRSERRKASRPASYAFPAFRSDVLTRLRSAFGDRVDPGRKAIFVPGAGNRRNADVLAAASFRRYYVATGATTPSHLDGLCFFTPDGKRVDNFPRTHSERCTDKHQAAAQWFKPVVRIFKNMRNKAIAEGLLAQGVAPSYFIEGVLHNVPNDQFGESYAKSVFNALVWLKACRRDALTTASGRHYLLRPGQATCWPPEHFEVFLKVMIAQWNAG